MKNRTWTMIEAISCAVALLLLFMCSGTVRAAGDMPPPEKREDRPLQLHIYPLIPAPNGFIPYPPSGVRWCDDSDTVCTMRSEEVDEMDRLAVIGKACVGKLEVEPSTKKKPDAKELLKRAPPQRGGKS